MSSSEIARLLPYRRPRPHARARLLCFSFAGGSATSFRTWAEELGESVDVCAVELPGHGSRHREAPIEDISTLSDYLAQELAPVCDGAPLYCFGHSLGARVAFWLASRVAVAGLIASASPAPNIAVGRVRSKLPRPALLEELRAMGGTPAAVLESDELMSMFLPAIRADFRLLEHAHATYTEPVDCPVTIIAARDDSQVSFDAATAWRTVTTAGCATFEVTGGHFFLAARQKEVLSIVRDSITRWA